MAVSWKPSAGWGAGADVRAGECLVGRAVSVAGSVGEGGGDVRPFILRMPSLAAERRAGLLRFASLAMTAGWGGVIPRRRGGRPGLRR